MSERHHLEIRSKEHPLRRAVYLDGEELTFVSRIELAFDANGESSAVITVPGELIDIDVDATAFVTAHTTEAEPTGLSPGAWDPAEIREQLGEPCEIPVAMPLPGSPVHVVENADSQHALYYVQGYFGATGLALAVDLGATSPAAVKYMAVEYDPTATKPHSWHFQHNVETSEPEPDPSTPTTIEINVSGSVVAEGQLRELVERLTARRERQDPPGACAVEFNVTTHSTAGNYTRAMNQRMDARLGRTPYPRY